MSLIKADALTASSGTNTNIAITGKGSGKLKLGDGELLFPDADGSANQYIKTDGSANLAFATLPAGGWAFVSSQTASTSATIAFTGMEAGYDYLVTFVNILPTTDNIAFRSRLGITGPTYRSSGYIGPVNALAATTVSQVRPTTYMQLENGQLGNAADEGAWGHMVLRDPAAVIDTNVEGMLHNHDNGSTFYNCIFGYRHTTAEAHTAIEFFMASGNISVGEFKLYRRPNA